MVRLRGGRFRSPRNAALVERRIVERAAALRQLGVHGDVEIVRLGFPDGRVADAEGELADRLAEHAGSCFVATWRHDGHPDHEAVGRAAAAAASRFGARCFEYVVWAEDRHRLAWLTGRMVRRVPMDAPTRAAKMRAARCFRSQLEPSPDGRPVVPPRLIARLATAPELLLT